MLMTKWRGVSPPGGQEGPWVPAKRMEADRSPAAPAGVLDPMNEADWITAGVLHERYLKDILHYVLRRVPRLVEAGEAARHFRKERVARRGPRRRSPVESGACAPLA